MKSIVTQTVAGFVVACLLALPAVAGQHPNDRAGMLGVGAVTASAGSEPGGAAIRPGRPDGRELPDGADLGPGGVAVNTGRPDGRELPDAADLGLRQPTIVGASDDFDWSDAGIGLVGGIGIAVLLVAVLATTQHTRRVPGAS